MSMQWTPKWEEIIIERHGIRLRVKRDKETKLLACPVCGEGGDNNTIYFFNPDDLIRHLLTHAKKTERQQVFIPVRAIEAEEEEEHEEE